MIFGLLNSLIRLVIAAYLIVNLWLAFRKGWTTGLWKVRVERASEPVVFWITTDLYLFTLLLMAVALLARHGVV